MLGDMSKGSRTNWKYPMNKPGTIWAIEYIVYIVYKVTVDYKWNKYIFIFINK